jgi:aspartate oxidase
VFGARAARSAIAEAPSAADLRSAARDAPPPPPRPSPASRHALWLHGGLERDGAGLRELTTDQHPLVRLIATSALTRTESRGAHLRRDRPERDPAFDERHVTLHSGAGPEVTKWT